MAFKYPSMNRNFDGIGRIQKTYGTDDQKTIDAMKTMVGQLYRGAKDGHVDHAPLIKLRDGKTTLLKMFAQWSRQGSVKNLSDVSGLDFKTEAYRWVAEYEPISKLTRNNYTDKFNQLLKWKSGIKPSKKNTGKAAPLPDTIKSFKLGDLPKVFEDYKKFCVKQDTAQKFQKTKTAIQSFIKAEYTEEHPLYRAIQKIKTFSSEEKTRGQPWQVADVIDVMSRMRPDYAAQFWTMCLCGITLKPYSFGLTVERHGIIIRDSKQDHKDGRRNRIVPLIEPPAPMVVKDKSFRKALAKASHDRYKPSDARKCYEVWLQSAGIHFERRNQYCGWAEQSMSERYGAVKHQEFLREDAETIRAYIDEKKKIKVNSLAREFFTFGDES